MLFLYLLSLLFHQCLSNTIYVNTEEDILSAESIITTLWNADYEYIGYGSYLVTTLYEADDYGETNFGYVVAGDVVPPTFSCQLSDNSFGTCSGLYINIYSSWNTGYSANVFYDTPIGSVIKMEFTYDPIYCTENNDCSLRIAIEKAENNDIIKINQNISEIQIQYNTMIIKNKNISIVSLNTDVTIINLLDMSSFINVINSTLLLEKLYIINSNKFGGYSNTNNYYGGAIYSKTSNLKINNCIFEHCNSYYGGAIGIENNSSINITNSEFLENNAEHGGAIYIYSGITVHIENTLFNNNNAMKGGAIYVNENQTVTIFNITLISNNAEEFGGGIYMSNKSNIELNNSFISENDSPLGGSIYIINQALINGKDNIFDNNFGEIGAGIYNNEGIIIMENTSFTNNIVSNSGGAIFNTGSLLLAGCTFGHNQAGMDNTQNIISNAKKKYTLQFNSLIFENNNINSFFSNGTTYAHWKTCYDLENNHNKNISIIDIFDCKNNTICQNETIGYRCLCNKGYFQNGSYGTINCTSCNSGTYCPNIGTTDPISCPFGSYCNGKHAFVCPFGYYCPKTNISYPIRCDYEYLCPIGSTINPNNDSISFIDNYIADKELYEKEYEINKYAVTYYDLLEEYSHEWSNQLIVMFWLAMSTIVFWTMSSYYIYYKYDKNTISPRLKIIRDLDFFSTKHRVETGNVIRSKKTKLGGGFTLLWILGIFFLCWFYFSRYKYDNTIITTTHLTNESLKQTDMLNINIGFDGSFDISEEPFTITVEKGLTSSSNTEIQYNTITKTNVNFTFTCEPCIFNTYEININICSRSNNSFIKKINWWMQVDSFRQDRKSTTYGLILPDDFNKTLWKSNGIEPAILTMFLKPVSYINNIENIENNGFSIEYQDYIIGMTRDNCTFLNGIECQQEYKDSYQYIYDNLKQVDNGICPNDVVGFQIKLMRSIGLYQIVVSNKFMAMDMLSELFAMIGATTSTLVLLMVLVETCRVIRKKYHWKQIPEILMYCCNSDRCCNKKTTTSENNYPLPDRSNSDSNSDSIDEINLENKKMIYESINKNVRTSVV